MYINKENNSISKKIFYIPLNIFIIYLVFILILYIWGPLNWRTENILLFYSYIILSQVLIYLGYFLTINKLNRNKNFEEEESNKLLLTHTSVLKLLKILIPINLLMTCLILIKTINGSTFSINYIINSFIKGLSDAGGQYNSHFTTEKSFGGNLLAPMYTLMSPLLWPVLPLSFIYFKKLNFLNKIIVILTLIFEVFRWISIGTNKGIIDLILIMLSIIFLKRYQKKYDNIAINKINKQKRIKFTIITSLLIVVGFIVFNNNISSRISTNYYIVSSISNDTEINFDSPFMLMLPKSIQPLFIYTTVYLTQGYYGLSLALNEPFIPMFGVGNSYFLIDKLESVLHIDIWKYSYQSRIHYKGWDPFVNWHSIYLWLANDFSFPGVLLIMFFLGKYFAIVYYKSVKYKDPITSVLFCLLIICFFYFPCNNQVLSTPSTFMTFWMFNIFWFYKTKIKRKQIFIEGEISEKVKIINYRK